MRVIKVNGCHDCPYCRFDNEAMCGDCYYCYWMTNLKVDSYMKKAIFPDDCPLDEAEAT